MTTISIRVSDPARLSTTTEKVRTNAVSLWARFARWVQSTWCVVNGGHYKVLHTELVSEIANEPDYEAALKALG